MSKVPLISSIRPEPQVFRTRAEAKARETESTNKKDNPMSAKKAKAKKAPAFKAFNTDDFESKSESVQRLWTLLEKMDPDGLLLSDASIIVVDGEVLIDDKNTVKNRSPADLGLTKKEIELIAPRAVLDPDEEKPTGLLFTIQQLVELAYEMGRLDNDGEVTQALVEAVVGDDDDEEDDWDDEEGDDEDFDDDEMEVVNENETYDSDENESD